MSNISEERRKQLIDKVNCLREYISNSDNNDEKLELLKCISEIECEIKNKKFGLVFEEHLENSDIVCLENEPVLQADTERILCKNKDKKWNFLIEGDNLQALKILEKTHKGKVDVIYIDPPYNTGAKDWKYNNDYVGSADLFKHSKWLSMMSKRLKIARTLLKDTGIIVCAIDDYELLQLGMLMDDIFNEDNRLGIVSVVHKPEGRNQEKFFATSNEFALFYAKDISKCQFQSVILSQEKLDEFDLSDNKGRYRLEPLIAKNHGRAGEDKNLRVNRPHKFYPIYVSDGFDISLENKDGYTAVYPITTQERTWKYDKETITQKISDGEIVAMKKNNVLQIFEKYRVDKGELIKTHWIKKEYNANVYGTKILTNYLEQGVFDFPKSLYLMKDIINITSPKDGLILDFFAGSGTTGHAVSLLNSEDGGTRKFILVTNNEISYEERKNFETQGIKEEDKEWQNKGIAKYVTWRRLACCINGVDRNGNNLIGNYLMSDRPMSLGFEENIKYYKVNTIDKKDKFYYEYADELLKYTSELVELENAINFDNNDTIKIILTNEELDKLTSALPDNLKTIYLSHNVLTTGEQNELFERKGIEIHNIPDYYYKNLVG